MSGLRGLGYEFEGRERLGRPGQLIVANHPTLIDVVLIVAFTPAPACVVKAAPVRQPVHAAGRAGPRLHQQCPGGPDDRAVDRGPEIRGLPDHVP